VGESERDFGILREAFTEVFTGEKEKEKEKKPILLEVLVVLLRGNHRTGCRRKGKTHAQEPGRALV